MAEQTDKARTVIAELSAFLRAPLPAAINHLLRGAGWPRERLKPWAGRCVRFELMPWTALLMIGDEGDVRNAANETPDATIRVSPAGALRLMGGDETAWREAQITGDTELAREILSIVQHLRWDVEEDLSAVVGDIAAHRIVEAGRAFLHWQRETAEHYAQSASAYWTDEQPLLASKPEVAGFARDVDALRDDVERLEQHIERLERARTGTARGA
jgi:ubiquinone biosynthesis protein UbiJ